MVELVHYVVQSPDDAYLLELPILLLVENMNLLQISALAVRSHASKIHWLHNPLLNQQTYGTSGNVCATQCSIDFSIIMNSKG